MQSIPIWCRGVSGSAHVTEGSDGRVPCGAVTEITTTICVDHTSFIASAGGCKLEVVFGSDPFSGIIHCHFLTLRTLFAASNLICRIARGIVYVVIAGHASRPVAIEVAHQSIKSRVLHRVAKAEISLACIACGVRDQDVENTRVAVAAASLPGRGINARHVSETVFGREANKVIFPVPIGSASGTAGIKFATVEERIISGGQIRSAPAAICVNRFACFDMEGIVVTLISHAA